MSSEAPTPVPAPAPAPTPAPAAQPSGPSPVARMAIDLGPLVAFFLTYFLAPGLEILRIIMATGIFMIAVLVAMLVSQLKYRHVPVLLWVSAIMVIGFGGLTI